MKKTKTVFLYVCLFLATSVAFATDDDDEEPDNGSSTGQTTEDDCGFFCSIGEFFDDLFTSDDPC